MDEKVTQQEAVKRFGLDPESVGLRHRGWWVVEKIEEEEEWGHASVGDLCVKARDGGSNEPDMSVGRYENYRGSSCDGFDCTYRYYYFAPLADPTRPR